MSEVTKGHVEAGGVRYGYEIHGTGAPLLLLHGGFGTIEMFGLVLAQMAERRQGTLTLLPIRSWRKYL